jgi:hypothetical protein
MLSTYEAVYQNGKIIWKDGDRPPKRNFKMLVTVVEELQDKNQSIISDDPIDWLKEFWKNSPRNGSLRGKSDEMLKQMRLEYLEQKHK